MEDIFNKLISWWRAYYKFSTTSNLGIALYLLIVSIIFYVHHNYSSRINCKEKRERFISWNYQGVIKDKYKDSADHMYCILILKDNTEFNLHHVLLKANLIYNSTDKGDSLVKNRGSDTLFIYKKDIKKFYYYIFEECEE